MKKIFTLAVACLVTAGVRAERPAEPSDFTLTFSIENGQPVVSGSLKAPTTFYYPEDPLTGLDRIEITRSSYEVGESDEPVYTIENPTPGSTYTFTDECDLPLQLGYSYTYYARAYLGTESSYSCYKQIFIGYKPASPSVSIATADRGEGPVTLTMVAPVNDSNGNPLPVSLTRLVVKEYISYGNEQERYAVENPVGGQTYTWVNPDVTSGTTYRYRVYAECEYGTSDSNSAEILVGTDVPSDPRNLTVTIGEDGAATLSWEAPQKGRNGGWIDPAAVRYKIQRSAGSYVTLEDSFEGTTYVDPLADLASPQNVSWRITALNDSGEGGYAYTADYLVGPAASLPFIENVSKEIEDYYGNIDYDYNHLWSTEFSGYASNWDADSYDYSTHITGVDSVDDEEEGYIRFYGNYATSGESEWLRSPDIDMTGTRYPVLSFYITDMGKEMAIEAGYVQGGETVVLADVRTNGVPEGEATYTWRKVITPLGNLGDVSKVKLHFRAYVPEGVDDTSNFGLDKIVLDDYCPVEAVNVQNSDDTANLSWEPATNGRLTADRYLVAVNGAEPVETAATSHSMTTVKGANYTVSVTPVYGDIPSAPTTVSFIGGAQVGITGIQADETEVEYFTPDGLRALDPQKGMLLIRRAVTRDGKVRTSKVVL